MTMKNTLLAVGIINLTIACTNSQPLLLEDSLKDTQATNQSESKKLTCNLKPFMQLNIKIVDKVPYRNNGDLLSYIRALEEQNKSMVGTNILLLSRLKDCLNG